MLVSPDLPRLRSLHGESAALWAAGVQVQAERWVALSGAPSAEYNVALCHGAGATALSRTREEILAAGAPGLVMVAGGALGEVQELIDEHWVCVGSAPFMARALESRTHGVEDGPAGSVAEDRLPEARELIADVFDLDAQLAEVALPSDALEPPGRTLWATFDERGAMASCLVSVAVQDAVVIWSMATRGDRRRRGHGRAVLEAALAHAAADGCRVALLHASASGEPFYRSAGFAELERWQLWSRPRWVLGHA